MSDTKFREEVMKLIVSDHGYVLDTGSQDDVNAQAIAMLKDAVERHELIWQTFFMIA